MTIESTGHDLSSMETTAREYRRLNGMTEEAVHVDDVDAKTTGVGQVTEPEGGYAGEGDKEGGYVNDPSGREPKSDKREDVVLSATATDYPAVPVTADGDIDKEGVASFEGAEIGPSANPQPNETAGDGDTHEQGEPEDEPKSEEASKPAPAKKTAAAKKTEK